MAAYWFYHGRQRDLHGKGSGHTGFVCEVSSGKAREKIQTIDKQCRANSNPEDLGSGYVIPFFYGPFELETIEEARSFHPDTAFRGEPHPLYLGR